MTLNRQILKRSKNMVPMQGDIDPWKIHHNYPADKKLMNTASWKRALCFFRAGGWRAKRAEAEPELAVAAE